MIGVVFVELVGKTGAVAPEQIALTEVKVGVSLPTITAEVNELAQLPDKVWVAVMEAPEVKAGEVYVQAPEATIVVPIKLPLL